MTLSPDAPHSAPVLDIVMPFWGDFGQFQDAVRSVLAQTDPAWRLVVIDDAYPDAAPGAWVRELDDPRMEYRRNPENLGVSGNFRAAVRAVEAEFATIMGCDDLLLPGYVARMRELADRHRDAAYFQPGVEVIDADGHLTRPLADRVKAIYRPRVQGTRVLSGESLAASLLRANWTYFPSIMWRRDLLQHFDFRPDYEVVLDLALQIEIVRAGGAMVLDSTPTFRYRRHAASVSSWRAVEGSRFEEERRYLFEAATAMRSSGWPKAARAAAARSTSRLNALSVLPTALVRADGSSAAALLRHGLGR